MHRHRRTKLTIAVMGAVLLLTTATASAATAKHQDAFMKDVKESVYATNQHMSFSIRATLIRWLGGVPVVKENDVRASELDRWWGEPVPGLPAGALTRAEIR